MANATIQTKKTKPVVKKTKDVQRVSAKLKNLRIAPRKVRLVANLIKGKQVDEALVQLKYRTERSARPMEKLLASAVANAENNAELERDNLKIDSILVDEGMTIKRFQPRAQGRAYRIFKRSSHITLQLAEIEAGKKIAKKKAKPATQLKSAKPEAAKQAKDTKTEAKDVKEGKEVKKVEDTQTKTLPGTAPVGKNQKNQGGGKKGFNKNIFHRRGNM
ncbi:50S ribosomal protein L22 [Patescibacteria group bacterium]